MDFGIKIGLLPLVGKTLVTLTSAGNLLYFLGTNNQGCEQMLPDLHSLKPNLNRPRIRIKGAVYYASHVAKYTASGETTYNCDLFTSGTLPANEIDLSHLCHNPYCFKASHLVFEPNKVNAARETCSVIGRCLSHPGYQSCYQVNRVIDKRPEKPW